MYPYWFYSFVTKKSLYCMLTTSDSDSPAARSRTKDKYIFWLGYGSGSERPLFSQSKQPVPRVPTTRHFTSARIKLLTVGGLCFVSVFLFLSIFNLPSFIVPLLDNDQRNWKWEWEIYPDSGDLESEMRKHLWLSHSIIATAEWVPSIQERCVHYYSLLSIHFLYLCHR